MSGGWRRGMFRSAEAVRSREALGQDLDQQGCRKADDVQVVTFDALDERRAEPLDRVAAGTPLPLAAAHVMGKVARGQSPELDPRRLAVQLLPRGRPETETRHDLVRPARQPLER